MTVATEKETKQQPVFGYSEELRPFDHLSWKQLKPLLEEAENVGFYQHYNAGDPTDKGGTAESFFLKLFSFLSVEEVLLAPRASKLDIHLKIDIILRLTGGANIGLQIKSSELQHKKHVQEYRSKNVFLYSGTQRREYPAPASVWANVEECKPIELLAFLSRQLGIPVSGNTKVLVERYKLLKQLSKGSKLGVNSTLVKSLKVTSDEIYNLSFLKLVQVEGGTIYFL